MNPISVEPGVYGRDVIVTRVGPDPGLLDRVCALCETQDCRAVARVFWDGPGGSARFVIGRDCIPDLRDTVDTAYPDSPPPMISVEVPAWRTLDLARDAKITPRRVEVWTADTLLRSETGNHPGRGIGHERLFLADMVERARYLERVSEQSRKGISPRIAALFLAYDRDLAYRALEALNAYVDGEREPYDREPAHGDDPVVRDAPRQLHV